MRLKHSTDIGPIQIVGYPGFVDWKENGERMICPGCQNGMESVKLLDVELDQCSACKGVWLDHREIDQLFAMPNIPARFMDQERYGEAPEMVDEGSRQCPRCVESLRTVKIDGIVLDACPKCRGIFADMGELKQLAEAAERRFQAVEERGE